MERMRTTEGLEVKIIVTGMHLSQEFGMTVDELEAAGWRPSAKVEMLLSADSPTGIAKSMGVGVIGMAQVFSDLEADALLLLGDRFETFAAATAWLPFAKPIGHIAGGEVTEGVFDEAIRHALTKMSHLHFASTERYRRRIVQMGEEPSRVFATGSPTLDSIANTPLLTREELEARLRLPLDPAPLLVTFHPLTLAPNAMQRECEEFFAALDLLAMPVLFTYPNADTAGRVIVQAMEEYARVHDNAHVFHSLGRQGYYSLMSNAAAMVGNSSSGIIEAASFGLPVVNVGTRQRGRDHGRNVIHTPNERHAIVQTVRTATSPDFRGSLQGMANPYGDGNAAERIVRVLVETPFDYLLVQKRFHDMPERG